MSLSKTTYLTCFSSRSFSQEQPSKANGLTKTNDNDTFLQNAIDQ